ncbi:MAG TPA: metallopeptidase family protein [Methylomirabilota bacterium]|jgi:predicted Zn-dependent protease with MMP-like domain|nr:metallopeptidase family protein [Methylomirabilota bacterium]
MPERARTAHPPSAEEMVKIAEAALAGLPEPFLKQLKNVAIRVEEFADDQTLAEMGIDNPFDLTGLYHGVPLIHQSVSDVRAMPEMIYLYRQPILAEWCESDEDLAWLVRHVLIHEIGHHFGYSDEELEAIEAAADQR